MRRVTLRDRTEVQVFKVFLKEVDERRKRGVQPNQATHESFADIYGEVVLDETKAKP